MEAGCQISTNAGKGPFIPCPIPRQPVPQDLRFPTDSKSLSSFLQSTRKQRSSPDSASLGIGLERAFTEVPPDIKVLPPKGC